MDTKTRLAWIKFKAVRLHNLRRDTDIPLDSVDCFLDNDVPWLFEYISKLEAVADCGNAHELMDRLNELDNWKEAQTTGAKP